MAIPIGGIRRPVTIVDCAGDEVMITDGKLNVNASVTVPGDVPSAVDGTANLAVAPLDFTDAVNAVKDVIWLSLHLTAPLVAAQTLTVTLDSGSGAGFDTIILNEVLPIGFQDKFFALPATTLLRATDHIKVHLTNAGGPETATANATLMFGV